jgi:hypothetical protein
VQARREDVDEQRPQRADAVAGRGGAAPQGGALLRVAVDAVGLGRERVRDADEVLHHAVVEVGRDQAPLGVGGVERAP